jgi:hypothetical protein
MRASALLSSLLLATALHAQGSPATEADSIAVRFHRIARAARERLSEDAGRMWGARLDTIPWLGVAGGRAWATEDPRVEGFAPAGALWAGTMPAGVSPANTSLDWAGRRWAMIVLPLGGDSASAVRLLIHEAMHVAQPAVLPRPAYHETAAGADLLDRPEGRVWLGMEWRALAAALEATGAARSRAAVDALIFRARRHAEAPATERSRERALDAIEGLPEYAGWALTGGDRAALARAIRGAAPAMRSFVRGFPYYTGPAYAFLLDALAGGWRARVAATPDLQLLLAAALPSLPGEARALIGASADTVAGTPRLDSLATAAGARYGLGALRRAEEARWTERERQLADLRARFVAGPTIRVRPGALRISFDERAQTSLGADGTVYGRLVWRAADGAELNAPAGALVTADWTELRVPLDATARRAARLAPGPLTAPLRLEGEGWALVVPSGWIVEREGDAWVVRPGVR